MTQNYEGIPDIDYPADGLDIFDKLAAANLKSKRLDVLAYLYRHADPDDGIVIATYKKINQETGVSEPTIAKVMKKLQQVGSVTKLHPGIWKLELGEYEEGEPYSFIRKEL